MSTSIGQNLSEAFKRKLKGLAINEFPCGNGKWRSGNTWRCEAPDLLNPLKEPNADLESSQSLLEMLENEPFQTEADWSEDIDQLRKLAIQNPDRITEENIFTYFTKLRLAGMDITAVDDILLKFTNLKEVALTANRLQDINLENIPKRLEALELYGNTISSIDKFCCSLPFLHHLGIGKNSLTTINKAIHPTCWKSILSMDLSFNGLTSLKETLDTLKHLPKLRALLLQGNPLFLSSLYRGYIVDTLKSLTILDDIRITADEKHRYKDISKLKGINIDEAIFDIQFNALKGIKASQNAENDNSLDEFPRTDYRYQVGYPFLMNCTVKKPQKIVHEVIENDKDLEASQEIEERFSASETDDDIVQEDACSLDKGDYVMKRKTKEKSWCEEEIKIEHERKFITTDLLNLKRFFLEGISLDLIENKVVVSLDSPEDNSSLVGDGENDKSAKGGKSKQSQKDKPKQPPAPKTNTNKNRKKAKGEEMPLYELSRESKTIGAVKLTIDDFVHGTKHFEKQCTFIIDQTQETESEAQQEELKDSRVSNLKKPPSLDGRKKGKDSRRTSPSPAGQRNRSAMSNKHNKAERQEKNSKVKDSKILGEIAENGEEVACEITIDVCLSLISWKTAKEIQEWITENQ